MDQSFNPFAPTDEEAEANALRFLQRQKLRAKLLKQQKIKFDPKLADEDSIHKHIWLNLLRDLPPDAVVWSVESRDVGGEEGKRRKDRGVISGPPEMYIRWQHTVIDAEIKAHGEYPKPHQKAFHLRLKAAGFPVVVWRSYEDARATCLARGLPMRPMP